MAPRERVSSSVTGPAQPDNGGFMQSNPLFPGPRPSVPRAQGNDEGHFSQMYDAPATRNGSKPVGKTGIGSGDHQHHYYSSIDATGEDHVGVAGLYASPTALARPAYETHISGQSSYEQPGQQKLYERPGQQQLYEKPGHQQLYEQPGQQRLYQHPASGLDAGLYQEPAPAVLTRANAGAGGQRASAPRTRIGNNPSYEPANEHAVSSPGMPRSRHNAFIATAGRGRSPSLNIEFDDYAVPNPGTAPVLPGADDYYTTANRGLDPPGRPADDYAVPNPGTQPSQPRTDDYYATANRGMVPPSLPADGYAVPNPGTSPPHPPRSQTVSWPAPAHEKAADTGGNASSAV